MDGPAGVSGGAALCRVDPEWRIDLGLVPIPRQPMVDHSVLGIVEKAITAIEMNAQVKYMLHKRSLKSNEAYERSF